MDTGQAYTCVCQAPVASGMSTDMCMDMYFDMCMDMHTGMCRYMCTDKCADIEYTHIDVDMLTIV